MLDVFEYVRDQRTNVMLPLVILLTLYDHVTCSSLEVEPTFDVPVVNVTVIQGKTAILPCRITEIADRRVVWTDQWNTLLTLEEKRIIDDDRISIERPYTSEWNLHIRHVKYADRGPYICQINTSPVKMKTVNLNILVPAQIIDHLSSNNIATHEGDTVTLVCNVTGVPTPDVRWYRKHDSDEDELKEEIGVKGEVLIIHNITRYCDDKYICVAANQVPPAVRREMHVTVEFEPEVRLQNRRLGQRIGKETILECIISAYPQGVTVWKRKGETIHNSWKYRVEVYKESRHTLTLSLRIRDVSTEDYGEYTCEASNKRGMDFEKMTLYQLYARKLKKTTTTTTTTTIRPQVHYNSLTSRPPAMVPSERPWTINDYRNKNKNTPVYRAGTDQSKHGDKGRALGSRRPEKSASSDRSLTLTFIMLCVFISGLFTTGRVSDMGDSIGLDS